MERITQQILLYGSGLQPGENTREVCPRCDGGSDQEKSLSITLGEDGVLRWQCFRAKCEGVKGTSETIGTQVIPTSQSIPIDKKPRRFEGKTQPLRDVDRARIRTLWGIENPEHWYWTNDLGGRIAMSIRSPKYTHRGWVMRDMRGTAAHKAITYLNEGEEGLSWYREHPHAPTVVVEDIPSAVRASRYVNAVALCGTGIGWPRAQELNEYATKPIILALDNDATATSFKIAEKYKLFWGDVKVLPLKKDLKNMTEEELCVVLNSLIGKEIFGS